MSIFLTSLLRFAPRRVIAGPVVVQLTKKVRHGQGMYKDMQRLNKEMRSQSRVSQDYSRSLHFEWKWEPKVEYVAANIKLIRSIPLFQSLEHNENTILSIG